MLNKEMIVNIKKIVRYLELKGQLTTEELQMAETMVGLTESDKEALVGLLQPVKTKSKPTATKRVIEHCAFGNCGLTRRAAVHKISTMDGYHEFLAQSDAPAQPTKSRHASSLAGAIKKKTTNKEPRCVVCFEVREHDHHDLANGGHLFETSVAARANEVLDKHNEKCAHVWLSGELEGLECSAGVDANVHQLTTTDGYHEFVGGETAVGVGGD